jgi:predicted TIM-barrel fold metal-dependent hydrolase
MLAYTAAHPERMRAVVSVEPAVTDAQLETMHRAGARGIRVNLVDKGGNPLGSFGALHALAERIQPLGWHVELLVHAHELDEIAQDIRRLPVDVSIGHFGYMPARMGVAHPKYRAFLDWVAEGRCWVKLSGPYRITGRRETPYDDVTPFAHALVARRPDRILWGTDWPHPIVPVPMPNDGDLADHLPEWIPDEPARRRILVDNPAVLYGFPAA